MCDQNMMLEYVNSLSDSAITETCMNAISNPSPTANCECWSKLDQTWLYENFNCKWSEDDDETLLEQYTMYCLIERAL